MSTKQISLTLPENLFNESMKYSKRFGYRNVQEFILELLRNRIHADNIERYQKIEQDMKRGKNVKKFTQKEALEYLKSL